MLNFHLDTDFGGDPDDFAALLMLLGLPDVRITGITTVLDDSGLRAGAVRSVLRALDRNDIPVAPGARVSLTRREVIGIREDFWSDIVPDPVDNPLGSITAIERSMWMRSVWALTGPYTNGAMFERVRGGMTRNRRIVHMGGYLESPASGFPPWNREHDFNVQHDPRALVEMYGGYADITMVPMPVAMNAWITTADVKRIAHSGSIGAKLADQLRRWSAEQQWGEVGKAHPALPDDLAGIMWDPLTVLIATGWDGVEVRRMHLHPEIIDDVLYFQHNDERGRPVDVVTSFDADRFREIFLKAIEDAQK